MTTTAKTIKFNKHFITDGTTRARVWYRLDNRIDNRKCVNLSAKDYEAGDNLSKLIGDAYVNNTDTQTDYFEKGRVVLFENHPLYAAARARAEQERG